MRFVALLCSLFVLLPSATHAKLSKADCKAHAVAVTDLAKQFGMRPGIKGRALLDAVESWVASHDEPTIRKAIGDVERTTRGIEECNDAGFSNLILKVKGTSQKMKVAVLPWLKDTAAADPCQGLINQAIRKRTEDLDGAIADLERSTGECRDDQWLPESFRNLVELYYERGDLAGGDYTAALERTRKALGYAGAYDESQREVFQATLAKATIEAGAKLMEQRAHDSAKSHWRGYIDAFGTESFDVLFRVEQIAQGTWMLRDLKDARYQLTLACVESGDLECVRESMLDSMSEYIDDMRPIKELTERVLGLAVEGAQAEGFYVLGFDLLTAWNELEPGTFQINRLLDQTFLELPRQERLVLLRLTDKCWIPMQVAEALRQEGESYLEEVEVAAGCGDSGGEAQQILMGFHVQAAQDQLDRLGASSIAERRKVLEEVERQLLPKLGASPEAASLKSRIADERRKIQTEIARMERQRYDAYSGCTQLLATIQWNRAREKEYDNELRDFKNACCGTLMAHTSGWAGWMRSRPEGTRLVDAEIDNKQKLMKRYCQK